MVGYHRELFRSYFDLHPHLSVKLLELRCNTRQTHLVAHRQEKPTHDHHYRHDHHHHLTFTSTRYGSAYAERLKQVKLACMK